MKSLIKITRSLIVMLGITLLSTTLFAQPQDRGKRGPMVPDAKQIEKMVNDLDKELELSKDQKTKILDLYTAHFDDMKKLMEKRPEREEMEKIRKAFELEVTSLLTDDQKVKYLKYIEKNEHRPEGQRPRR